ncbi:MAG: type II secretion system F family protein [Clostridia bacterium]|nr:type II secretion system F family protein [Clostridia bacterium]
MPEYVYRAVTKQGQIVRNKVEESSKSNLVKRLKNNDLLPIEVVQVSFKSKKAKANKRNVIDIDDVMKTANSASVFQGKAGGSARPSTREKINMVLSAGQKITMRDLIIFTQNFYLLKKANFNNIHALSTIINSTDNLSFRGILEDILAGVEAGEYMYTTMEYYSNVFPYIYINMIRVGELSGSLTTSLSQAVRYLDETSTRNKKIKSIIVPNVAQFIAIFVLLIIGTIFVLPAIEDVFVSVGGGIELPAITKGFMNFLDAAKIYWYVPVGIIAIIVTIIVGYINTPKGKYNWHYFKYRAPVFGRLIFAIDFSRLMRAMLLNLQNGMRIQESLEVSKTVIKNYVMLSIVETAINNILMGGSWIEPFENSGLCSSMEIEMLKIGMQTDLPEMMEKLLDYMDMDIQNSLEKIMKVLPEISYLFVGILLIFLVVVVLVPCIQLYMGDWLIESLTNQGVI